MLLSFLFTTFVRLAFTLGYSDTPAPIMDGSLIRLPLDEGKPPLEADLRKDIYIQWAIMNQNWVMYFLYFS